mmetsp:Transcript_26007/g.50996  ORF Transcript_26007/g.50996 Transcript_26007/m.50996 type:complete len:148 (+) Transcript_26007:1223-1666(+)
MNEKISEKGRWQNAYKRKIRKRNFVVSDRLYSHPDLNYKTSHYVSLNAHVHPRYTVKFKSKTKEMQHERTFGRTTVEGLQTHQRSIMDCSFLVTFFPKRRNKKTNTKRRGAAPKEWAKRPKIKTVNRTPKTTACFVSCTSYLACIGT